MGERQTNLFQPTFNRAARVAIAPTPMSEDAGAIALREVAEATGLPQALKALRDPRAKGRVTYPLPELVLSRLLPMAQGRADQLDANLLRHDPAFRVAVSSRRGNRALRCAQKPREPTTLASQPTLSRMNHALATDENLKVLCAGLLATARHRMRRAHGRFRRLVVDVDSFANLAHGRQAGAKYNGHYRKVCHHPIVAITHTGDIVGVMLRPGNVHTANDVTDFLEPIIAALLQDCDELLVRVDSGYADGELFAWLAARGVKVVTRLRSNTALKRKAADWRTELDARWDADPADSRPARHAVHEFEHQASTWDHKMRAVAVVVERDADRPQLFRRQFYLCTDLEPAEGAEAVLGIYRQRGNAERHIGELKGVLTPRLSCASRRRAGRSYKGEAVGMNDNAVVLLLTALAYNLMHALRCGLEAATDEGLSLGRLRKQVLKTPCTVGRHARRIEFKICPSREAWWRLLSTAMQTICQPCEVAA